MQRIESKFVKAKVELGKLSEKLIDLKETGNNTAEILLNKLQHLTVKKLDLTTAAIMARGEGASEPQELFIYSFAPCTSLSVEKNFRFYILFFQDKSNITETTMLKLLFVQYNIKIFEIAYEFNWMFCSAFFSPKVEVLFLKRSPFLDTFRLNLAFLIINYRKTSM